MHKVTREKQGKKVGPVGPDSRDKRAMNETLDEAALDFETQEALRKRMGPIGAEWDGTRAHFDELRELWKELMPKAPPPEWPRRSGDDPATRRLAEAAQRVMTFSSGDDQGQDRKRPREPRYVLELTLVPGRDVPEELQPPKGYDAYTRLAHVSSDPDGVLLCWELEADHG